MGGRAGTQVRWKFVFAAVGAVLVAVLLEPQLKCLGETPVLLMFAVGVIALWSRGRRSDGVLFAVALPAAAYWGEPYVGPLLLAAVAMSILAITSRPRFSLASGCGAVGLLLASAALKRRYAGSAFTSQDVFYFFLQFTDNIGVMLTQPAVLAYAGALVVALVAVSIFLWRWDRPTTGRHAPARIAALHRVAAVVVVAWSVSELGAAAVAGSKRQAWDFFESRWESPITTFLSTLRLEPKPVYQRSDPTPLQAAAHQVAASSPRATRPADIVVFLQESQFNPATLDGCPAALCEFGVFKAPPGTTDYGELRVHVFGGGTWLTEFALAAGVPHTLYGRAGEYAPFNLAPGMERSFVRSLRTAGYYTVAVYPVRGGMMNARAAYRGYGFDEFLDSSDLGLPGSFDTPDAAVHQAAFRTLRKARALGRPVFLLAVTIFNHGDHGIRLQRVAPDLRDAMKGLKGTRFEQENLVDYLWRTREFSNTMTKTSDAVMASDRPTVLAWFGDHRPPFGNAQGLHARARPIAGAPQVPPRFVTWYNVSANFGGGRARPARQLLDIAFLPGVLAQRAGVPLDDWLAANVAAREVCGGLLAECRDPVWREKYFSYVLGELRSIPF